MARHLHEQCSIGHDAVMECTACGRKLTNDVSRLNAAAWTLNEPRSPYCGDSDPCRRDAEIIVEHEGGDR